MPRAAWYADPYGAPGQQRWCDGKKWTKQVRDTPNSERLPLTPLRRGPRSDGNPAVSSRQPPGAGDGTPQDQPHRRRGSTLRIDAEIRAPELHDQPAPDRPHYLAVGGGGLVLTLSYSLEDRAWKLERGGQRAGLIGLSSGYISGAAGSWRALSAPRAEVLFDPRPPADESATFSQQRLWLGGTLRFSDGTRYRLGRRHFDDGWRLATAESDELLYITLRRRQPKSEPPSFRVELRPGRQPEPVRVLATLASCYVVLSYAPWARQLWTAYSSA